MTTSIQQKIVPMVWFDNQAEEAANFYASVFPNTQTGNITRYLKEGFEIHGRPEGSVMTIELELDGQRLSFLNGGPYFKANPSISFFATYEKDADVNSIWKKLSEGGKVLMPLDKYPFSPKFGWVEDKYGISWQICVGDRKEVGGQSIVPSLLFVNEHHGQAEKALNFYTSVFKESSVTGILRYGKNEIPEQEGTVKHAQFTLQGQTFMVTDSALKHEFTFNEGISLMVYCQDQQEIDYYWDKLSQGGDPKAQMCGWLKDQFGVSWQVVPTLMDEMWEDADTSKLERVTRAYLKMKKFDLAELQEAFDGKSVMHA